MKEDKIVELVREGFLEKYINVYTAAGKFIGTWYAVDLSTKTIEIEEKNERYIIDITQIVSISYFEKEPSLDDF